jgi:tetratricopeptide (TPR) repeat protein
MKCNRCGLQSDVEQAFSTEKSLLLRTKHYCPDCTVRRHAFFLMTEILVFGGCGLLLYALSPASSIAVLYLNGALVVLLLPILILIHELAHAAVGKLVRLRVFGIAVGIGRTVWQGRFRDIEWAVNMVPVAGITAIGARPMPHIRGRIFLVYLAGPTSHILLALACHFAIQLLPISELAEGLLRVLIFANLFLAVVNLLPRKAAGITGAQGSDGWHLLRTPSLPEAELTKQYVSSYAADAIRAYTDHDFDKAQVWLDKALALDSGSAIARNVQGILLMARREYAVSRETFLQLIATPEGNEPGLHYILLNNVAYLNALLRDPALLPEADQLSAETVKHLPWLPAVLGTRGAVLVELGRLDEGIALLKKAMSLHVDKQGKALNACHVALGEIRRGNPVDAQKYLVTARALDPRCFLLADVEAQVTASRPVGVLLAEPHTA